VLNLKKFAAGLFGIIFPYIAFGQTIFSSWEFDLGLGFILNSPEPTRINISNYETDQLVQTKSPTNLSYYIGVRTPGASTPKIPWLKSLTLGLSNYYTTLQTNGSVYQYQVPLLNNYTYNMDLSVDDLLLELKFDFHSFYRVTPFLVFGTGIGFGTLSYNETANPGVPGGQNELGTHNQTLWAFDIGAGGTYALTEKLGLTLQYLYITHADKLQSNLCQTTSCLVEPLQTHMNLSEIMVSLRYQFG
jgi:opacity protein-like surface antigen